MFRPFHYYQKLFHMTPDKIITAPDGFKDFKVNPNRAYALLSRDTPLTVVPDLQTFPTGQQFRDRKDDTSEKVIHESSSTSDSERTESETETAAPKGDKDQGEVDSSTVTSGVSIPVSFPEKAHEALAGPDPEPMKEDQTGSDSGKLHVSSSEPNPSVLPGPDLSRIKNLKNPKDIIKAKKEQGEEKQDSTYSIKANHLRKMKAKVSNNPGSLNIRFQTTSMLSPQLIAVSRTQEMLVRDSSMQSKSDPYVRTFLKHSLDDNSMQG
ncbi:hypothetical protein Tco_0115324 [Tanacetum coccineum]